jgi:hypothetical protein
MDRTPKKEIADLPDVLEVIVSMKEENQKLLSEIELLKKESEKLRGCVEGLEVYGTDECPLCIKEFGHSPIESDYNRVTLLYSKGEHLRHSAPSRSKTVYCVGKSMEGVITTRDMHGCGYGSGSGDGDGHGVINETSI